ncbi:MAG: bacteriocin [Planctomycetes bacterium]|nr:bacteriocin [Planctomycetota bacterium]NUQ34967.1 bacteriocin [Planctomycetaceae bacterium]
MKVISKNEMNAIVGGLSWSGTKVPPRNCIGPMGAC